MKKLADNIDIVFEELKPKLTKIANRFNVPNPTISVDQWMVRCSEILSGIDAGNYKIDGAHGADRTKLFKYLGTAFKHDLFKEIKAESGKTILLEEHVGTTSPEAAYIQALDNKLRLSDLISLISDDLKKLERKAEYKQERMRVVFLSALVNHFKELLEKAGNIVIVNNRAAKTRLDFFTEDVFSGLTDSVVKYLEGFSKASQDLAVVQKCDKLLAKKDLTAINHRTDRYFKTLIQKIRRRGLI